MTLQAQPHFRRFNWMVLLSAIVLLACLSSAKTASNSQHLCAGFDGATRHLRATDTGSVTDQDANNFEERMTSPSFLTKVKEKFMQLLQKLQQFVYMVKDALFKRSGVDKVTTDPKYQSSAGVVAGYKINPENTAGRVTVGQLPVHPVGNGQSEAQKVSGTQDIALPTAHLSARLKANDPVEASGTTGIATVHGPIEVEKVSGTQDIALPTAHLSARLKANDPVEASGTTGIATVHGPIEVEKVSRTQDIAISPEIAQPWLSTPVLPELNLDAKADDFFSKPELKQWIDDAATLSSDKDPYEKLHAALVKKYETDELALADILVKAAKVGSNAESKLLVKRYGEVQLNAWKQERKSSDDVYSLLQLDKEKELVESPALDMWVSYLQMLKKNPEELLFEKLQGRYKGAALADAIIAADSKLTTIDARQLDEKLFDQWWKVTKDSNGWNGWNLLKRNSKWRGSAEKVFELLKLNDENVNMFDRPVMRLWITYVRAIALKTDAKKPNLAAKRFILGKYSKDKLNIMLANSGNGNVKNLLLGDPIPVVENAKR